MTADTCAAVIAATLRSVGANPVFGVPGGETVDLIDALASNGAPFILAGSEPAAAFMASTVGRLTGTPGVCLATLGPGACHLALGVAAAYLDRDPLLAFSACTPTPRSHLSNKQNLPLNELYTPITKWSVALTGGATAATVRSAVAVAQRPPRGPVYLSLPSDVATAADRPGDVPPRPPELPEPDDRSLGHIGQALRAARRPVAVVGPALDPQADAAGVRNFLAKTGMPYVAVPQGKGIADETGPGYLGIVAGGAGDGVLVDWLADCDCLLGIGFDPVESHQDWHFQKPLYALASGPVSFAAYQPALQSTGSVAAMLDQLGVSYSGPIGFSATEQDLLRQRLREALVPPAEASRRGLAPCYAIEAVCEALPDDTIVTTDVGAHMMMVAQVWHSPACGQFLLSNGLAAMGYAVPAAVAALIQPHRPVVSLVGDGAFAAMVHELETARRLNVGPLFVVLCDRSLAIVRVAQRLHGLPRQGVDFAPVDWARVAAGFGLQSWAVSTLAGLRRAVAEWRRHPGPSVLAVAIDEDLYTGLTC